MRSVLALAGVMGTLACVEEPSAPAATARATILRASDTVRFEAPAAAHHCREPKYGMLIDAVLGYEGVLLWLRGATDPIAGSFPLIGARDTVTARGAVVAVRYMVQSVAHTLALDSGMVAVTDSGGERRIEVGGSGLDVNGGARVGVRVAFDGLPAQGDSLPCARAP